MLALGTFYVIAHRVGVLGHAAAGKSTLVGVLTRPGLSDNGRGLARMQVFRHNHEVFNGQTSSVSQQGEEKVMI